jgi:hypothetical protein
MDSGRLHDDLEPWWFPVESDPEARPARRSKRPGPGTEMLAAAMFGLADGLGYERPNRQETMQVADAPIGNCELPLDFGELDPLD